MYYIFIELYKVPGTGLGVGDMLENNKDCPALMSFRYNGTWGLQGLWEHVTDIT